ncbi:MULTISPECIES: AraC family transcriptional regulator [Clostridium]|uniref:AraC family transcriptional regulator n=1 Tax=Clostridium TaxID=1485 RepID=UPI00069D4CAB|nr:MULTISPECIES: AraC family transcriptional regulator [Clostridium]KOF56773.1 AraC family transcriptional regulator [Clostridium sp. DMHC 10]MCD2346759.1 AraC family transcriptional regulator [Clostridium guangxiense]
MKAEIYDKLTALTDEEIKILNGEHEVNKSLYTDNSKFVIDSSKLLPKGQLIDIRKHTRFINFPNHTHNYIEVSYVYEGSLIQIIDGRKIKLEKGEIIFLNQYITHEIEASGKGDIIINFIIKPEFFDYILTLLGDENVISKFLITTLYKDYEAGEYLYFKVSEKKEIQDLLTKIITELYELTIMRDAAIKLLVGLLLVELSRNSENIEVYSMNNYEKMIIISIFKYIDENYNKATLGEASEKLKQPNYKLSKLIKKHTGMTFKELLQEKRLSKAIELLQMSSYSISEIIELVGYENPTYFYKIFEKKYGVTPRKYNKH